LLSQSAIRNLGEVAKDKYPEFTHGALRKWRSSVVEREGGGGNTKHHKVAAKDSNGK